MSSFTDLFKRVQVLSEAKVSPVGKQAPVFANVPKQMKAAGMASSSRDAMIFITQVLSRLDIITPEVYEMTVKGQHKERMEKLMTILRSKEEEINAKSDEIVEYINQNLDNYTSGAGADRGRTEKYKAVAKAMSQEVQNIKAGKEADDALRDIVKTADEDTVETLEFSAEDTTTIIEINTGNVANVEKVKAAVEEFANELGVEVTGNTVEFSVDEGSQIDQMVKKNGVAETEAFFTRAFAGDYPISVSIIPPAGAEEKEKVKAVTDAISSKPEGIEGREHIASVGAAADRFLKKRGLEDAEHEDAEHEDGEGAADGAMKGIKAKERLNYIDNIVSTYEGEDLDWYKKALFKNPMFKDEKLTPYELKVINRATSSSEDAEGKYDDNDGEEERCDYVPCTDEVEDAEVIQIDPGVMETISVMIDAAMGMEDTEYPEVKGMVEAGIGRDLTDEECTYLMQELGVEPGDFEDEEEVVSESKYTTADYITDIYADVKPIVETLEESVTVNENGQTTHTQQYLVEKREEAIEQVYTNHYLTEQKASDSLLVPKEEKRQSFKERYQPKTSYQLEELRRYGL